jgi:hypothetical protein
VCVDKTESREMLKTKTQIFLSGRNPNNMAGIKINCWRLLGTTPIKREDMSWW